MIYQKKYEEKYWKEQERVREKMKSYGSRFLQIYDDELCENGWMHEIAVSIMCQNISEENNHD